VAIISMENGSYAGTAWLRRQDGDDTKCITRGTLVVVSRTFQYRSPVRGLISMPVGARGKVLEVRPEGTPLLGKRYGFGGYKRAVWVSWDS
jgi:hypothetical protein